MTGAVWKRVLTLAGLLVAGWIAFAILVGIDTADAVAYNRLDKHVASASFKAGDLVSISPDGERIDLLCGMEIREQNLRDTRLSKSYANWLDETLPAFAQAVSWSKSLVAEESAGAQTLTAIGRRVEIDGRILTMPAARRPPVPESCTCAVAEALVSRATVCVVGRSLNEFYEEDGRITERTLGANFRDLPILIPDVQALGCDNISEHARIPETSATCSSSKVAAPVWLRQRLSVIREYELAER